MSSRLSGARSSKLHPDERVDGAAGEAGERGVDLQDAPAHVEHRDTVRGVGDQPLGAGVGGLDVVEPAVLVGDVAQHEQGPVGLVGDGVQERHRVDRHQPRLTRAEVVGLDDQAAHRLAVEGPPGGALALGQHPAVTTTSRRRGQRVELLAGLARCREPTTGRVVVQQHGALAVHDDEGVGDGLGDDPEVLGLSTGAEPGRGGVGDEHVALPLHRREHQAEQRGEHHERLERQHLARHVADLTERAAVRGHDQTERDEGGGGALQRGQRDRQPQPAPDQHGEGEERQRDGAPGAEDQPEHRERDQQ